MSIAEKLYTQGFISYPRTETNIFPKELDLGQLVQEQLGDNRWGPFAQGILAEGGPNPRRGQKSDQVMHTNDTLENIVIVVKLSQISSWWIC